MDQINLEQLRGKLTGINQQLLDLLSERAQIAQEIGHLKEKHGIPGFDPVREKQMLEELVARNTGPLDHETIRQLFKQIFQATTESQQTGHKNHYWSAEKAKKQILL